jgi:hypothetical protein
MLLIFKIKLKDFPFQGEAINLQDVIWHLFNKKTNRLDRTKNGRYKIRPKAMRLRPVISRKWFSKLVSWESKINMLKPQN